MRIRISLARLCIALGVLTLDLGTKWAFYDSSKFNPGLARVDGWLLIAVVVFCLAVYAAEVVGTILVSGVAGIGFALWLGASLGQAIQFAATGSVSDWIPVGPIQNVTMWTNLADLALLAGAGAVLFQWGWRGQFEFSSSFHVRLPTH